MANLLTIEAKKNLANRQRARQIIIVLIVILIWVLVGLIFNATIWFSLKIQQSVLSDGDALAQNNLSPATNENQTKIIKDKALKLNDWWPDRNWAKVLTRLNIARPTGVKISQFSGQRLTSTNLKLFLSGQTENRQELVKFADQLRQDEFFTKVDLPIDSLLGGRDNQYRFNLEI